MFAAQAKQVFYVNDLNGGRWSVLLIMKPKLYDNCDVCNNIKKTLSLSIGLSECDDIDNEDVAYVLKDFVMGCMLKKILSLARKNNDLVNTWGT